MSSPPPGRHRAHQHRSSRRRHPVVRTALLAGSLTLLGSGAAGWQLSDDQPAADASLGSSAGASVDALSEGARSDLSRPASTRPQKVRSTDKTLQVRVPETGSGAFTIAPGSGPRTPGREPTLTYQVEIERDLPFRSGSVARTVDETLQSPRGWSSEGDDILARVDGSGDIRVVLATPSTADALCAPLETRGRLSCRNGRDVVINAWRWVNGGPGYERNIDAYRQYVVNHEVGHALGYPHVRCPSPDVLAPVMLQQTLGLDGCRPNPWPAAVDLVD